MKLYKLLSILFIGLSMSVIGCGPDDDPIEDEKKVSNQELFLGTWVYENFTDANGVWEEQKILPNGKIYYSSLIITPFMHIVNSAGNYYFTDDNKVTCAISSINGGTTHLDITLQSIRQYEYVGTFLSDGSQVGPFTYHKVVGEITMNVGDAIDLVLSNYVDCDYYSPYAVDKKLLSVISNTCTAINAGFTYLAVPTDKGEAYIGVTITDLDNIVPDFTETLLMTREQIIQAFPLCNTAYANTLTLAIRGNEYTDNVIFFAERGQVCDEYQINLRTDTKNASDMESDIHKFLSRKYEYQYKENGIYYYFDLSNPYELPLIVAYVPKDNFISYFLAKIEIEDLWYDFTEDLGLSKKQISTKYGSPLLEDDDSMTYFIDDNEYYWATMYLFNTESKVRAIGLLMNATCDMEKALNYLNNKYYLYEEGCNPTELTWAFINKPTISESTVGIIFDGTNYIISYTALGGSKSRSTVFEKPYFDLSKTGRTINGSATNSHNYRLNPAKSHILKSKVNK